MPITIREILASDTISQAADKINFNFDQLLLNGGGPRGPIGPPGPIGPIGGRGIRGSVWYEGTDTPINVPPTLTPEDEDNYLRANGDVWTYSGSANAWLPTGINLRGPIGPAGTSGKFSEYRIFPYDQAGDTTMYPNPMTISQDPLNEGVRAVIIGGLPSGIVPGSGDGFISPTLAQSLVQPDVSLLVHQFASNQGGIKFHGGSAVDNFTDNISSLSSIRLAADDILTIDVPKPAGVSTDGLRVLTGQRNQLFQAGKEIKFQTGTTTASVPGSNSFIVEAQRNGGGAEATIDMSVLNAFTARLGLGGSTLPSLGGKTGALWADAGQITLNGSTSITGTAPAVTLNGTDSVRIAAGSALTAPATGHVQIGASQQISLFTSNNSAGGGIIVATGDNTPGNMVLATGASSTGNITISTASSGATGNITLLSGGNADIGAANDVDISASNDITVSTSLTGGDILIATQNTGASIGAITAGPTSPITLATLGLASPISLATVGSNIVMNSNAGGRILATANGYMELTSSTDYIRLSAADDIEILHGSGDQVTIRPVIGNSNARIDVTPLGTGSRSSINIFHDAALGDTNLLLRSDATNGGEVSVSPGMQLSINGGITVPLLTTDPPAVSINALNHYIHNTQITAIPNAAILSSGEWSTTLGAVTTIMYWQRIGNVINVFGNYIRAAGGGLSNPSISLPVIGSIVTSALHGSGTVEISSVFSAIQVDVGIFPNTFSFISDVLPSTSAFNIKFSFSYVIQ